MRKWPETARLSQVEDSKGPLGWGLCDPHSPLAIRILSLERQAPNHDYFVSRFERAWKMRDSLRSPETNAYRLFNGEGDGLPGLVCDVFDTVAVVQFDGLGPAEFWDRSLIADWLTQVAGFEIVFEKTQREKGKIEQLRGSPSKTTVTISENSSRFEVDLENGQKTGFFFDQRDNREFVRRLAKGKRVLNLFSYSGGFSIAAGLGGAEQVTSVDLSEGAIVLARENWKLNGLPEERHAGICADAFAFLKDGQRNYDHIIVDPPSLAHSEQDKPAAKRKYIEAFSSAAKLLRSSGELSLSSCSSHITFADFFEMIDEALSLSRRRGQIMRVSGQGLDHPFPHACPELRYLKFVHLILD